MRKLIAHLKFVWGPTKKELRQEVRQTYALLERERYYSKQLATAVRTYLDREDDSWR